MVSPALRPAVAASSLRRPAAEPAIAAVLVLAGTALLLVRGPVVALAAVLGVAAAGVLVLNVELAALVFVAVAPFEGYAKSASGSAVKVLGAVLFLAWLWRVVSRRTRLHLEHPVARSAAVLLAVLLASTVLHTNGTLGFQVLVRYLSYLAALVVLVDCMQDRLTPARVARVYVAACAVAGVFGLVAFFRGQLRAGGPVGDPNDFAFFLVTALPLALALRHGARRRYVYDAAALVVAACILATASRGALVGIAAMIGYGLVTRRIRPAVVVVAVLAVSLAVPVIAALYPDKVTTTLSAKGKVAQENVSERLTRWHTAAEMTSDNPLLGLGPAGFRENYDRYIDYGAADVVHHLDVSHDTYLEVSSELGVPGLAAFLGVLAFGFAGARRRARSRGRDDGFGAAVCTALIGGAVAAVFLTEQYYLPLWLLAALGAALDPRYAARPTVAGDHPGLETVPCA